VDIASIAEKVCKESGIGMEELKRKGRSNNRSLARGKIASQAVRKYQLPVASIARFFSITPGGVSKMISRMQNSDKS
jgi:hypothetical protein